MHVARKKRLGSDAAVLLKNTIALFFIRGVNVIVPVIEAPYLIRTVGVEKYGVIVFSLSFAAYFASVMSYGFMITATRDIARNRSDKDKVSAIYSNTMAATVGIIILSFCVAGALIFIIPGFGDNKLLFMGAILLVSAQSALPAWLFNGLERMGLIAVLSALSKIGYILVLIFLVKKESDYIYVNIIYATCSFVMLILALVVARFVLNVRLRSVRVSEIKKVYAGGYHVFLMQAAPILYSNSSVFFLGVFASSIAVGLYSAAMKVTEALTTVGRVIATVFLPYISRKPEKHSVFAKAMMILGIIFTVFVFVFSEKIAHFMYAGSGSNVKVYLQWLSFSVFFGFSYLVYGVNYLALSSHEKDAAMISVGVSLLGFVLIIALTPIWGLSAVIAVFIFSRMLLSLLSCIKYMKFEKVGVFK